MYAISNKSKIKISTYCATILAVIVPDRLIGGLLHQQQHQQPVLQNCNERQCSQDANFYPFCSTNVPVVQYSAAHTKGGKCK